MRDGIRIGDFESALLQIVAVIKFRATDKEGAFRIDHHADLVRLDNDVPVRWAVHQVHLVLQARTPAPDDCNPESAAGSALLGEEGAETLAGGIEHLDQFFVSDAVLNGVHVNKSMHRPVACARESKRSEHKAWVDPLAGEGIREGSGTPVERVVEVGIVVPF